MVDSKGSPSKSGSETNTDTEGADEFSTPPRGDEARKVWAIRRYYGIGPDGRFIEEWTGEEVASALGVSPRTVYRWVNEEESPLIEDLDEFERWALFAIVMSGDEEQLEEYLTLRRLEEQSESRKSSGGDPGIQPTQVAGPNSDPHPIEPAPEGFSW